MAEWPIVPWRSRGLLDELLPEISTDVLAALLAKPEDARLAEGPHFEFKAEWTPRHVAKAVAALANTEGGFLIFGAEAAPNGVLRGFPGLEAGREWPREIANNIIGHVSPLPAWEVFSAVAPGNADRAVVVVKVPWSHRTPHVRVTDGRIYQRSPGGTSDPIRDRATLDVLVQRGLANERALTERAERFFDRLPALHSPDYDRVRKFQFAAVATPLPFGAFDQPGLLTARGAKEAASFFMPNRDLGDGVTSGLLQDGLRIQFGEKWLHLSKDGTVELMWQSSDHASIPVAALDGLLEDVLAAQARLPRPVREARVFIRFGGNTVDLTTGWGAVIGQRGEIPWEFNWTAETLTGVEASSTFRQEFQRRLWRAAGVDAYDPD